MNVPLLIESYLAGPGEVRRAIEGLTAKEIDSTPVVRQWTIRQVVCHLADAEILYADRMKRILAEDEPAMVRADPEAYVGALAVASRDMENEVALIAAIRMHVGQILASLEPRQFERRGIHSTDGPLTLLAVLERVTAHIPHHVAFIEAKRRKILEQRA